MQENTTLQLAIFITRPSDLASFCLYDGFWKKSPAFLFTSYDNFNLTFAGTALPLAGAAALVDIERCRPYTGGARVEPTLYLRSGGLHSGGGELHFMLWPPSYRDYLNHSDIVRYFESFAPFAVE